MKAVGFTRYGSPDVLEQQERPRPVPKSDEVLIRIHCATVTAGDCEMRRFHIHPLFWLPLRLVMGLRRPKVNRQVLGQEFSGVIEEVGEDVTLFKPGQRVFGGTGINFGAYAAYRCQKAAGPLTTIPEEIDFDAAATIPTGGLNGLHFVRKGEVSDGDDVLINGAGGSIGTYALQIAKLLGATVTCVDSAIKLEALTALGADHVIDYEKEDFSQNGTKFDVIIDIAGHSNYRRSLASLKPGGRYVLGNPTVSGMVKSYWGPANGDKKVLWEFAADRKEDLDYLKSLVATGKIKSLIDRHYNLDQLQQAHQYVEDGRKVGNLVIDII